MARILVLPTAHSQGPRRAASPRTRVLLKRPHGVRLLRVSLQDNKDCYISLCSRGPWIQRCYARAIVPPVPGRSIAPPLHTTPHQDINIGHSFDALRRSEQGSPSRSHTGEMRLDELDKVSRRALEGLGNGINKDFIHLVICTHC